MEPSDNNAERKNLVLISAIFIIYHLAGGYFVKGAVGLQVVNLAFERPQIIKLFAVGLLFWSAYRYWLCNRCRFPELVRSEINRYVIENSQLAHEYVFDNGGKEHCNEKFRDFAVTCLTLQIPNFEKSNGSYIAINNPVKMKQKGKLLFQCERVIPLKFHGILPIYVEKGGSFNVEIRGSRGYFVLFMQYFWCFFLGEETNTFLIPYLLFFVAFILTIIRCFQ
jgi:hypothetical protein